MQHIPIENSASECGEFAARDILINISRKDVLFMSECISRKEWIVHCLVQYQMEKICSGGYGLWLLNALESGFQGFCNMSDEELDAELKQRGLRAEFDVPDAPIDEDDDAEFDDNDDEWRDSLLVLVTEEPYAA